MTTETELIKAAAQVLVDSVLTVVQNDPHLWSNRPCQSCRVVTSIVGKPFGCYEYQRQKTSPPTPTHQD